MSTYRLTDDDRETLSLIDRHFPEPRSRLTALVAAVEAIIAPIHARAEEAEAAGTEVARQMLLQVEAHRARAKEAEKRADLFAAALRDYADTLGRTVLTGYCGDGCDYLARGNRDRIAADLLALLPDDTKEADRG